jgi:hypothetical protein
LPSFKLLFAAVTLCLLAAFNALPQSTPPTTPNIHLYLPGHGSFNWDTWYNANWNLLDTTINGLMSNPALPYVTPEQYNAVGNGNTFYDGVIGSSSEISTNTAASSTTPNAPAITTTTNNAMVVSIFQTNATWSSAPATGTQRIIETYTSGEYAMTANDQTVATAGSVAAVTGTLSSASAWNTATIALKPVSGQTISFVDATGTKQSSGGTITVSEPSGVQSGDLMLACVSYYVYNLTSPGPVTYFFTATPSGWGHNPFLVQSDAGGGSGGDVMACFSHVATNSEPSTYSWSQSNTNDGMTAIILDYRNVLTFDGFSNVLTSPTAGFTSGSVGNPICLATQNSSVLTGQVCGTISAYTSATQVTLSVYAGFGSSTQFSYGSDDTSHFQTAISAGCAKGCIFAMSPKRYVLTGSLTLPKEIPIHMIGAGPGAPATGNSINDSNRSNLSVGTQLLWLTQSLTSPAISVTGTLHNASTTVADVLEGFAMWGGTGFQRDGGSLNAVDGIDILNWQQATLREVFVFNFSGNGLYMDALSGGTYTDWLENIQVKEGFFSYNYGAGIKVAGLSGVNNIETVKIDSNVIEMNGGPGVLVAGSTVQGFTFTNNTIQWNNHIFPFYVGGGSNGSAELTVSGTIQGGCVIEGNYFEADNFTGNASASTMPFNQTTGLLACTRTLPLNFYLSGNWTPLSFTTSQLPSCGATNQQTAHAAANISDATGCTNGTSLTGGGSTNCVVTCKTSTNTWTETGTGWY